ncbi:MAG: LysM peptidoglycan-binding domain-containing protein [Actinomycetota bacterium]|nr:LysM peptidoglycan-binding domain-containing protein [Actinomycetota bacterium]MDQ3575935.1 LysM peptidoglycan-binding domain-containing protein [Actinomycetota bacterium]
MSMYAVKDTVNDTANARVSRDSVSLPTRPQLRLVGPAPSAVRRGARAVFWRRRVVALLVVATLALAAKGLVGSSLAGSQSPPPVKTGSIGQDSYVVQEGDTLWGIARAIHPSGDVRPVVDALAAGRRGAPLRVGERIALP